MGKLKQFLKTIPGVSQLAKLTRSNNTTFPGSSAYWEKRYSSGGNSGSGSYGRLARFKADVLNAFVAEHAITSVIEFGCGDGHQLSLASYPQYTGLDISETAVNWCSRQFKADLSKQFLLYGDEEAKKQKADLSLSIDVIFHLVEDATFEDYMKRLFIAAKKYVIVYSSNYDNSQTFHEKERAFVHWVEANEPDWKLFRKTDNPYPYDPADPDNTSKSDFYFFEKV